MKIPKDHLIESLAVKWIEEHKKYKPGKITRPTEIIDFALFLDRFIAGEEVDEKES